MTFGIGIWGISPHSLNKILPSILNLKHADFKGFLSRKKTNSLVETNNFEIFSSQNQFLNNPKINLIIISTPPSLHYEHAKAALLAGKNIIINDAIFLF